VPPSPQKFTNYKQDLFFPIFFWKIYFHKNIFCINMQSHLSGYF
jgi:hypothetical protein